MKHIVTCFYPPGPKLLALWLEFEPRKHNPRSAMVFDRLHPLLRNALTVEGTWIKNDVK